MLSKKPVFLFLFCFSILLGSAYTMYVHYDFSHTPDTESYLEMAQGNFNVTATHRYRIIIPFLASSVAIPINMVYAHLWPHRGNQLWPLRMGFFIVNLVLFSLAGTFIFLTCQAYNISFVSSIVGVLAILTSRWAVYISSLPMIDSLYILTIAIFFYAVKCQSRSLLILTIFLGPIAKEAFVFIAPMYLLFARKTLNLPLQLLLFILSGLLVFAMRFFIDHQSGSQTHESIENAFNHVENVILSFKRVASVRGIGELLTVLGTFTFIIIGGCFGGKFARKTWTERMEPYLFFFFIPVSIHAILSQEIARMIFIAAPVFAITIGLILDFHPYFLFYRQWVSISNLKDT